MTWAPAPPRTEATRGHRAGTWRAALHTGPSGQRSASKAHDRDRPAGLPRRYLSSTSQGSAPPPDAGQPQRPRDLPSGVRQARQHRDRRSTTTSLLSRRPTTGPCQSPSAQRTFGHSDAHCRCLRDRLSLRLTANFPGAGRALLHSWSAAGPARTGGRTAVSRDHTADRRIEQAAVGWCGDPQLRDHESLGVLFPTGRHQPGRSGPEDRYASRTRVPEATCRPRAPTGCTSDPAERREAAAGRRARWTAGGNWLRWASPSRRCPGWFRLGT